MSGFNKDALDAFTRGQDPNKRTRKCIDCGKQSPATSGTCNYCAGPLQGSRSDPGNVTDRRGRPVARVRKSSRSRGVFIALAILLGGLGVHNFYAGHVGRGFGKIFVWIVLPIAAAAGNVTFAWVLLAGYWVWIIAEAIFTDRDVDGASMRG